MNVIYLWVNHAHMNSNKKVLFILKKRQTSHTGLNTISSGLLNSANFVNDMLNKNGVESDLVEVKDNNCIDREVTKYKPTHVIIEALWVVPSKFEVLTKLHPNVEWIIRLHSDIPFLANEGIAIDWIYQYLKYEKVKVSINSKRADREFEVVTGKKFLYLPNYYPVGFYNKNKPSTRDKKILNVGCFGAVRPMKNHLLQAFASIEFADKNNKSLHFHINIGRVENNGDPVLKNLRYLFENNQRHKLIEHKWMTHNDFIDVIQRMDIGLQVSFSETFNIVSADLVNNNIPVVVSDEISWVSPIFYAKTTSSKSIVKKMKLAYFLKNFGFQFINKLRLGWYSSESERIWVNYFN